MRDSVLVAWIIANSLWDVIVWGTYAHVVFWRGRSIWWFIPAALLTCSTTLFKVLRKKYGIPDDEEEAA